MNEEPSGPSAPSGRPGWRYRELLAFAAITLLAQILAAGAAVALAERITGLGPDAVAALLQSDPRIAVPVQLAAWIPGLAYMAYVITVQCGLPLGAGLGWLALPRPMTSYVRAGALLALGSALVGFALSDPSQPSPMQAMFANRESLWVLAVFGTLVAPAIEEIVFRGFLYGALERMHGRWVALAGSSLVFAALHGSQYGWRWQHLAVLLAIGCAFGAARMSSGSVKASTVVHAAYNGMLFLALAWLPAAVV